MSRDIRLLVVCDGQLRFGESSLSLSLFLRTLNEIFAETMPASHRLQVTTAYRRGAVPLDEATHGAQLTIEAFSPDSLGAYDMVWLFGHESGAVALSTAERRAFMAFVAGGGSLFATGDHGAMGRAMCGGLPFIDAMRSWDGLDEHGRSVDEHRPYSVDTRSPGDPRSIIENRPETDHPTKTLFPSFVRRASQRHPHPVMSLPGNRVLRALPQHRHEGVCFEGEIGAADAAGQVAGEARLVARAMTLPGQDGNRLIYEPRCVGVVGILESPRPGWGRCAVDSTFHHFIDTNIRHVLVGDDADAEDLRRYYLNLLLWLYLHDAERQRALLDGFAAEEDDPAGAVCRRLSGAWWAELGTEVEISTEA